jgi:hypothetical protein
MDSVEVIEPVRVVKVDVVGYHKQSVSLSWWDGVALDPAVRYFNAMRRDLRFLWEENHPRSQGCRSWVSGRREEERTARGGFMK